MGNHQAGTGMGRAALAWWSGRADRPAPDKAEALAALDRICKPYEGADAEFEADEPDDAKGHEYYSYTDPEGPLGRLMAIAFDASPACFQEGWEGDDDDDGPWWSGPYGAFRERYRFC